MKKTTLFFAIACTVIIITQFFACGNEEKSVRDKNLEEGYQLSKQYCGSCHLRPEPGQLNKVTWAEFVMPKMGVLLGFHRFASDYVSVSETAGGLTVEQWRSVVRYYVETAPEKLESGPGERIDINLPLFTAEVPPFRTGNPATTMVAIDTVRHRIVFGDGFTEQLYFLYPPFSITKIDSVKIGVGISHVQQDASLQRVITMGVLHPSDAKSGSLSQVDINHRRTVFIDTLQRPVHARYVDLNNDGSEDVILCEFGNATGQLSWFEKKAATFTRHVLRPLPGSVKTEVYDFNKDGRPDIIALLAQGDEGFFIYYNSGDGQFREERVLQLSPAYGSNYFELVDWNRDGFPDILATNGDNGDYPPILKPYHGIRLYLNDGNNHFSESFFLPVNGVGKVMAKDFDLDGDLDLASISYFPDYQNTPEESFIFWRNQGGDQFQRYSFSDATAGRWLTMDANDLDGDGDIDIVLGNTKFPLGAVPPALMKKWEMYSPSVLILRNSIRK